ncbi:MAG TPA: diguanylate cyclase [Firmicutes bacterium]|nr:diguanylate cyclase [Bacillota bacterium]
MVFNYYSLPLYFFSLLMVILAVRARRYKTAGGAKEFSLLVLACALYSSAYGLEISSIQLETVLFWLKIEYLGIAAIPALYILFALAYTGRSNRLSVLSKLSFFIIPLITVILFYTNHLHGLIYRDVYMDHQGIFPVIFFTRGPWYWVQNAYVITAVFFSNILFLVNWFNASEANRRQIAIMLVGSLVSWLGLLFYLLRPLSWNLDLNPFFLSLSSIFFAWGLFRYRLFDLVPIARTKLFEELPDGVLILDPALRIIDINDAARRYLDFKDPVEGQNAGETFSYWPKLAKLLTTIDRRYHVELLKENEQTAQWFRVDFLPLKEKSGSVTGHIVLLRDITDRKETEEELKTLATTDMLTGLWNRRYFMQVLEKELQRARRYGHDLSLIMLDVDHFKTINDSFGHQAGDCTLRQISCLFLNRLRAADTAARFGGEEIAIILPETKIDHACELAEVLKELIASAPVNYENREIPVTVSMGVTALNGDISGLEDLLSTADQALYRAKEEGRNRVAVL